MQFSPTYIPKPGDEKIVACMRDRRSLLERFADAMRTVEPLPPRHTAFAMEREIEEQRVLTQHMPGTRSDAHRLQRLVLADCGLTRAADASPFRVYTSKEPSA